MYTPIPIKRSSKFGNNYWEAFSPKAQRNVRLFSDLEYDHWIFIETDPKVRAFCERPLEIKKYNEGKFVKAMFDMWIEWENGEEEFINVRYSQANKTTESGLDKYSKKTKLQQQWCQNNGKTYTVKTEKEIRSNSILLSNMKMILPYISNRPQPIETDLHKVKRYMEKNKKCFIEELESQLDIDSRRLRESVYWFLYHGQFKSNMDLTPIGPRLEVWISDQKPIL